MKAHLSSQDGAYLFPLGPKVTTIGRENCDISINSALVDYQHALIEYDETQNCFVLKDLNSTSGTYVHECRVQNTAVRLADKDILRFGINGLSFEFRIEQQQQETTMPSIYPRQSTSNTLHFISHTVPSRRITSSTTNQQQQQIDVRYNPGFSLRTRPMTAGLKSSVSTSNLVTNAMNSSRNMINGSFTGELEITGPDNTEITNRVDQLEKDVKGRDTEIRQLNDRLRTLEPLSATFTTQVHSLKTELDKVKREKQAATGFISSLQRDLHSKESNLAKLGREIDGLKADSRDKDLRLQSLQSKLSYLRERNRTEDDRLNKEKELKIKLAEQQIHELNENLNRFQIICQEKDRQITKLNQNEQILKLESEQKRRQCEEIQRSESVLKSNLANEQQKYHQFLVNLYRCFSDDNEYDEDENVIIQQLQQLQRELQQCQNDLQQQRELHVNTCEQQKIFVEKFVKILQTAFDEQIKKSMLIDIQQQINDIQENSTDNVVMKILKQFSTNIIDHQIQLVTNLNSLITKTDISDEEHAFSIKDLLILIRRQNEKLEEEKQSLFIEQTSREQAYRSQMEQITLEKDAYCQRRLDEQLNRFQIDKDELQNKFDEELRSYAEQLEKLKILNNEHIEELAALRKESTEKIQELNIKLNECENELNQQKGHQAQLEKMNEKQQEELNRIRNESHSSTENLNGQIQVYKDQVRQFSATIVQLEKNLLEEQEKRIRLQTELDHRNKIDEAATASTSVATVIPVFAAPVVDLSNELFSYKSRVQEQEQIIVSLRRDLAGMTARLSDVQSELSEKQKQSLERCESTIQEQTKELNETRLKLSKLSDIIDRQAAQIETLQSDLSKSKALSNQYQLLVEQRQIDVDRLKNLLEEKSLIIERPERNTYDEGRISNELISIGAECKGQKHEQTIGRQREALNELRARIKSLEQLRPVDSSYEKVLQQVVVLKRELAELRARQSLPNDLSHLTNIPTLSSAQQQSQRQSSIPTGLRRSPSASLHSEQQADLLKITEERAAHAETRNSLQTYDELQNSFIRKLLQSLDIDDESLLNLTPIAAATAGDRHAALQQRQRANEILVQKVDMLRERLSRKEELLRDYEKDLGKLRQAEILLREKNTLLQDLELDKRSKEDEALFLRNTLKEAQDNLNQEKRYNSSIKLGRNAGQPQSNEFIRRSASSTATLHHHCPPDASGKVRSIKRDMNEKLARKDYEIKTLKQELHSALDTLTEQSNRVKLFELQSTDTSVNNTGRNIFSSNNS